MPKRTVEPIVWLLFSGGGMVAALVLPVLLLLFGLALPLGWITAPDHGHLLGVLRNPLVRLGLIPPNETQNLAAILAALNRIGLTPSISCSA